jgi:ParB-like chromosome segregation protein Spo0J
MKTTTADRQTETEIRLERSLSGVQPQLSIVYRDLSEIRPNPRNPRRHTRRQIKKLAKIMKKLGCNVPLLIDRWGNLLAGHARYEACRILGLTEVPTISLEHLDQHQARACF